MKEEIYINGTLMDVSSDTNITLVYQSPLFTDPNYILNNRTNSVDFPTTPNNLKAIDNVQSPFSNSAFSRFLHPVSYLRNGIHIFSGWSSLVKVTPNVITFYIIWGNINALKNFLDLKLRDVKPQHCPSHITWNDKTVASRKEFQHNVEFGPRGNKLVLKHPCVKVTDILRDIEAQSGIKIDDKGRFDDYYMPITRKKADYEAKKRQGVILDAYDYQVTGDNDMGYGDEFTSLKFFPKDSDVRDLYIKIIEPTDFSNKYDYTHHLYNVSEIDVLRFDFSNFVNIAFSDLWKIRPIKICATDHEGKGELEIKEVKWKYNPDLYYEERVFSLEEPIFDVDVSKYTYIKIKEMRVHTSVGSDKATRHLFRPKELKLPIYLIPDPDKEQEVLYGGSYPLYYNMPDWSIAQFLKNLIKLEGVFISCATPSTISFISVDDVYKNCDKAIDMTDVLILEKGMPSETTFSLPNFAQKNNFKYSSDKTLLGDYSSSLSIKNDTIERETDLVSVDFAGTDTRDGCPFIPLYCVDEKGELAYNDVTARILKSRDGTSGDLSFTELHWENILKKKYASYNNSISSPKVIKVSALLSPYDLSTLDLSVPIYSKQLGHYYAILSLTIGSSDKASLQLIQLKEYQE